MERKSYEAIKVDQFIARLIEKGYKKCFVSYQDEAGNKKNLIYDNKELLIADSKHKEFWKPYPETLYYLLSKLKQGKYKVSMFGQFKEPEADKITFQAEMKGAEVHGNRNV